MLLGNLSTNDTSHHEGVLQICPGKRFRTGFVHEMMRPPLISLDQIINSFIDVAIYSLRFVKDEIQNLLALKAHLVDESIENCEVLLATDQLFAFKWILLLNLPLLSQRLGDGQYTLWA